MHTKRRDGHGSVRFTITRNSLAACRLPLHPSPMFAVTEAEAAAIRTAFEQGGEFAAAVELRRLFPGVTDNAEARECARTIAAWKPLQLRKIGRLASAGRGGRTSSR
jgi:hypothetical protein